MNSANDEVDDYMSDSLLEKCGDVRPGIVASKSVAKRYRIENERSALNAANKKPKLKELESQTRDNALKKPIGEDNKGFAMMSKMGFKQGMTLGRKAKDEATVVVDSEEAMASTSVALKEPISVDLKLDRKGLGHKSEAKEQLKKIEAMKTARMASQKILHKDFEMRKRENAQSKIVDKNLRDSQKVCYELDSRFGLDKPEFDWFWPNYVVAENAGDRDDDSDQSEEEKDEDFIPNEEKLSMITNYIRTNHFYCLWCGVKYEDLNDLESNCPGNTKEAHEEEDLSNDL